jgi:hypothetical protein
LAQHSGKLPTTYNGVSARVNRRRNRNRQKCESRANPERSRGLPKYAGAMPIRGKAHFLRDAIPDPEKQRLSPATQLFLAAHSYRMVSERLTKDEFWHFWKFCFAGDTR